LPALDLAGSPLSLRIDAEVLKGQWRRWLAVAVLAVRSLPCSFSPVSSLRREPWRRVSLRGDERGRNDLRAIFLADPLTKRKMLGIGIVMAGLLTLSGISAASLTGRASIGDMLFIAAGSLWAGFGVIMRRFRLDPMLATTVAGVFGLAVYVPFYFATEGVDRLAHADGSLVAIEVWCKAYWPARAPSIRMRKAVQIMVLPGPLSFQH